jgi:EF hand
MRLILALGAAAAATTMIAYAQTEDRTERNVVYIHHGGQISIDADDDGWISRAESSAAADRVFAEFDRNDDGRLDEADRPPMPELEVHMDGPHGAGDGDNCTRTETEVNGGRQATIVCEDEHEDSANGERHTDTRRHVRVETSDGRVMVQREGGDGDPMVAPVPPIPPVPPLPPEPMFMMMLGEDSEADLNSDGAISQDEFRNMQLRLFDAHDVNGDGRVRAHRPPEPPTPPEPPAPPTPPARR